MALKVNLGSGNKPLPGFVNVDVLPTATGVDVIADLREPLPFEAGSASVVYASHVLEHFPHAESVEMLREWRRILMPGGRLLVAVPDLLIMAELLLSRSGWFAPPHSPWIGAFYGGQKDDWDFHKAGFTEAWLAHTLRLAGYSHVERVAAFDEVGVPDSSYSPLPFGRNISLNMRALNGGRPRQRMPSPSRAERVLATVGRGLEFGVRARSAAQSQLALRRLRRYASEERET